MIFLHSILSLIALTIVSHMMKFYSSIDNILIILILMFNHGDSDVFFTTTVMTNTCYIVLMDFTVK